MDLRKAYEIPKQLDEKTLAVAKKELNENPKQMASDIEAIRDWINKQDYMKSRTDDEFILSFLRTAKYSFSRAQELIRNFWVNRTEIKDWFSNRSFEDDSVLMEIADMGIYVKLPYPDKEGRVIIIQRIGLADPEKYDFDTLIKYGMASFDLICMDPRAQINGITMVLDMSGMQAAHATQMSPQRAQKMMKCLQDAFPVRAKGVNYYNYPKLFDAVFPIVKMFMKEKMKKRLVFHGSDLKSLHKEIPKSILPKEYGGDLDSISKINQAWVDYLLSQKKTLLDYESYGVDLAKVPKTDQQKTMQQL